jgi:hypothetical protein
MKKNCMLLVTLFLMVFTSCTGDRDPIPASAKAIKEFSLNGIGDGLGEVRVAGTIDEAGRTIAVAMPFGTTDVTALVATFTTTGVRVTVGSTVQISGTTKNDFTNPVTYTVTAADGLTQDYIVVVTTEDLPAVGSPPPARDFEVERMIFTDEALDCQTPVSKSSFTDADLGVTVVVSYWNFEANKKWQLEWYSPSNTLVQTQFNTLYTNLSSGCSWRSLSREDLRKFGTGQWTVKFYYDGQLYKTASFTYTLTRTDIWHSEKISAIPDYYQLDTSYGGFPEGGNMYCAPVSVSNSLMWLANNGFDSLAKNTADRKKDQYDLISDLASRMKTDADEGSSAEDILTGVAKYISDKGYKNFQLRYQGWRPCTAESYTGITVPDMEWIKKGIEGKGSVWLNIAWYKYDASKDEYNRTGGHWVTLVGSGYNGNPNYLVIHDPITGYTNHYVLPEKITSGRLTGEYKNLPLSAIGYYIMNNRMRIKADYGILDGAVVLTFN